MNSDRIVEIAKEAAEAAFDAFGGTDNPGSATAWDFIRNQAWEGCDGTDEEAAAVYESFTMNPAEWEEYKAAYDSAYRNFRESAK